MRVFLEVFMELHDMQQNYSKILVKAWTDPSFKEKLIKTPKVILKECGIDVPEKTQVIVYENTDHKFFLVIPKKPEGNLSEEELEAIAGGGFFDYIKDLTEGAFNPGKMWPKE